MILICTPTIGIGGSLSETIVVPVALAGGSFVGIVSPRIAMGGALVDNVTPNIAVGGSFVSGVGVAMTKAGSLVESCAIPVELGGSIVILITPDAAIAAVFSALSMNAKTAGVALYANFPLTSMFKVGLEYYGITAAGIVHLAGATDNGAKIDSLIVGGVSNLGMSERKNIPAVYLTMRCEGELELSVAYDERKKFTKPGSSGKRGLSDIRFPLPLGADGNQVQFEIRNVDGADFDLKEAQAVIIKRDRRR